MSGIFPSEYVAHTIRIPGTDGKLVPFSFKGREYILSVYDTPANRVLLKCARQVEKSTYLGNSLLSMSALRENLSSLYVSPSSMQTEKFSEDRLSLPISYSPVIRNLFSAKTGTKTKDNVLYKRAINGSSITLRYAFLNASRVRGIAADQLLVDELQDIDVDLLPVIEESLSHSPLKLMRYAGTPLSMDNAIEEYWSKNSTQCEWVIPCDSCGMRKKRRWNVLVYESIGLKSVICTHCGQPINVKHKDARWASMRTAEWLRDPPASAGIPFEGYRIPQPIVAWLNYPEILDKKNRYGIAQFSNEVLGLSYESAERLVQRQALVDGSLDNVTLGNMSVLRNQTKFMGIDWGGGGPTSHTLITIGGYAGTEYVIPFMYRMEPQYEGNIDAMFNIIEKLVHDHNVAYIGCDFGGGLHINDKLIRRYGIDKVIRYQYVGTNKLYYDSTLLRYMVNRTELLMILINAINRRNVFRFPAWHTWEDAYASDLLSVFMQYNGSHNKTTISRTPSKPDDTLHSILYGFLASMTLFPRHDLLVPDKPR